MALYSTREPNASAARSGGLYRRQNKVSSGIQRGLYKRSTRDLPDDDLSQIESQIENMRTRLGAVGEQDVDTRNFFEKATNLPEDQNVLFDTLDLLDRPGNAIRNVISSAQANQDNRNPLQAGLEGFTGQKEVRGSDLLTGMEDGWQKSLAGFGVDVGLDPLTYTPAAALKAAGRGLGTAAKAVTPQPIQEAAKAGSDLAGQALNVRHGMDRTLTGQGTKDMEDVYRGYHDTQRYMSDEVQSRGSEAVRASGGYQTGREVGRFMEGVTTDATPKVRKAAEILQAGNKTVSDYAIQSGVDLNQLENYMTHVPTEQGSELFKSMYKAGSDTGRRRTIAEGGDDRILSRTLDMPVDEANQVLRDHYNVDFDIFETNAFRASVIGQQRLINYTAVENAKNQILNNPNLARRLQPGENVRLGDNEVILQPEKYNFFKRLSDTGEEFTAVTPGQEYVVPKAVKRFLDDADPKMDNEAMQKFVNAYDKVHQMWKQTALFSVGFHLRNGIGNMYNMWVSGMPLNKIVQYQSRAVNDIAEKGKSLDEFKRQGLMEESIYRQDFGVASPERELMKRVQRADSPMRGRLRDPDKVDPTTGQARPSAASVLQAPFDASRELGLGIDLFNRYAHFRYLRDTGMNPAQAAEKVREVLFDYSALTKTERGIKRLVPFYCVPVETSRILTRSGWKTSDELEIGEDALTYNVEKDVLEWKPVLDKAVFPVENEDLTKLSNSRVSLTFTPEHRWATRVNNVKVKGHRYGGKREVLPGTKLNTRHSIIMAAPLSSETESTLTVEEARLLGWLLTDGYWRFRKGNSIEAVIYQHPNKFLKEVEEVAGGKTRKPHPDTGTVAVPVLQERIRNLKPLLKRGKSGNWIEVVTGLSYDAAKAMFEAMYQADGTTNGHNGADFIAAANPSICDVARVLNVMLGKRTSGNKRGCYISNRRAAKVSALNKETVKYTGAVWCPKTENGTWVMEQDGVITITGNTWMRNNIPFQLKNLAMRPKKAAQTSKAIATTIDMAGIDPETVPEWVQDAFNPAISGDGEGSGQFAGLNLPLSDLAAASSPLRMATGALTPLAKLPLELGTNFDTFRERPIEQFEGQTEDMFGVPLPAKWHHGLSQIGALRNLAGHAESVGSGDVGSILTAGIPREHDADTQEYYRLLDELRKLQDAASRYQQDTGQRPPTMNELR